MPSLALTFVWRLFLICMLAGLYACGSTHDRNVFGRPEDDHLMSHCMTDNGINVALYLNTGGGAAVGTSFSVTAEHKPDLAERQILYSDYKPSFSALRCKPQGFELVTSDGTLTFNGGELDALRAKPRDLSEQDRK
ncbi:MAG TPA: hypothetical protein VGU03_04725 [Frateuria sp.]|uniref:hypothetical protein n=1 Tax=Frateuria sp. TaxID=2211372 RepID=UPI002DEAC5B1|nr:hypothetical protein [Frateuria sp.]